MLIAEQDARGALAYAERIGREEGRKQGRDEGLRQGKTRGLAPLVRQFERRLGSVPEVDEQQRLCERPETLGAERLGEVVLDLSGAELARWFADPATR